MEIFQLGVSISHFLPWCTNLSNRWMDIGPSFLRQSGICKPLGRGGVASFNPCKKMWRRCQFMPVVVSRRRYKRKHWGSHLAIMKLISKSSTQRNSKESNESVNRMKSILRMFNQDISNFPWKEINVHLRDLMWKTVHNCVLNHFV